MQQESWCAGCKRSTPNINYPNSPNTGTHDYCLLCLFDKTKYAQDARKEVTQQKGISS